MRTLMLIAVGLAVIVTATPSVAQKKNSAIYPWERKGEQFRRGTQRDPMAKIRAREEKGLKALGLPSNKKFSGHKNKAAASPETAGLDRYAGLDSDRNGSISRQEYMSGRFRASRNGVAGNAKQRRYKSRLNSNFRAADTNRDGRISASEIGALGKRRF